jgi:hypothetical protein
MAQIKPFTPIEKSPTPYDLLSLTWKVKKYTAGPVRKKYF